MTRGKLVALVLSLLVAALTGCGPIYTTRYDYIPPTTESGAYCVAQCERNRLDCRRYEDRKSDRCNQDVRAAKADYEDCLSRNNRDIMKCNDRSFGMLCAAPSYSGCDDDYRRCFQYCGGMVNSHQECALNCDARGDSGAPAAPAASGDRSAPPPGPAPNDSCYSSGQPCTCSNTGWSGYCGTGPHKPGLYCRCQ
jgi:hypothetical protein